MSRLLVVRLDSLGDMLVCGPAVRSLAAVADHLTVLAGPGGAAGAHMLPGVDDVVVWGAPWIDPDAEPITEARIGDIVTRLRAVRADRAVILTSFHQSALPTALVLALAGITDVTAVSTDFPGTLLRHRLAEPPEEPEPLRMLAVACAAGGRLPAGDDGRLRVVGSTAPALTPQRAFVVVHPGASAPARTYPAGHWSRVAELLVRAGWSVVVTGTPAEAPLVRRVAAAAAALDATGVTEAVGLDLPALAGLLRAAETVIVANTGPAHLAAAVGTPVVSLFAPVVPSARWVPFGVAVEVLGDQSAGCRDSRARNCPLPGHPCLSEVDPAEVVAAAVRLAAAHGPVGTRHPAGVRDARGMPAAVRAQDAGERRVAATPAAR